MSYTKKFQSIKGEGLQHMIYSGSGGESCPVLVCTAQLSSGELARRLMSGLGILSLDLWGWGHVRSPPGHGHSTGRTCQSPPPPRRDWLVWSSGCSISIISKPSEIPTCTICLYQVPFWTLSAFVLTLAVKTSESEVYRRQILTSWPLKSIPAL